MQTQNKFTPGPWKLPAGVIGADKVWAEDQNGNETLVARGIENEHDAKLISLAPDMFNVLSDAANMLPKLTGENLEAYSKTFAAIASSILAKLNS